MLFLRLGLGFNWWYGSRWSLQNLLGFRLGLRLSRFWSWCCFGLWLLSWPFSLFLKGSLLFSFLSGRFVFGLSLPSSKGFFLLKLPLSLFQLFWSWIHQRQVPADMVGPLSSLSWWSCGLWFLRFGFGWWSFRLWFGLLRPFRCSWWSLSSRSQCHRDSSPCSCFCLRFCYNWGCKSMYCWSLACLAFVTRWASLVDPVGLVNPCSNWSRDSAPCTCLCNGFLSCSTSLSIVGS